MLEYKKLALQSDAPPPRRSPAGNERTEQPEALETKIGSASDAMRGPATETKSGGEQAHGAAEGLRSQSKIAPTGEPLSGLLELRAANVGFELSSSSF